MDAKRRWGPNMLVESALRIFPDQPGPQRSVPLSILDASVGSFAPTAAVWVYDPPTNGPPPNVATLRSSLARTLNVYPHWAGQVRYTKYDANGGHTTRHRHLEVVYGTPNDPGVELVVAKSEATVASTFPSIADRTTGAGAFDATFLGAMNLLPATPRLAPNPAGDLPALIVQISCFACGGIAIALKSSHALADAQTLSTFVKDWAEINRAMVQGRPLPNLTRRFAPSDLDAAAVGDIDAASPDPTALQLAQELPIFRYDWWASGDGCPSFMAESTEIPPVFANDIALGTPIPWAEWDFSQPVRNYLLYFSAAELSAIWEAASTPGQIVSRLDALQAHIWLLLMRAYSLRDDEHYHINLSLGVRGRLSPPLGQDALGSPIVLARVSATPVTPLASLAQILRSAIMQFTSSRMSALLHSMAFDVDAQRMWAAFIGSRNTIVTSWLRLGVYEVDFGVGRPRFVHSIMPLLEGIMQVMEAMPQTRAESGPWYQDGATVSLVTTEAIVRKVLKDPLLRSFIA